MDVCLKVLVFTGFSHNSCHGGTGTAVGRPRMPGKAIRYYNRCRTATACSTPCPSRGVRLRTGDAVSGHARIGARRVK